MEGSPDLKGIAFFALIIRIFFCSSELLLSSWRPARAVLSAVGLEWGQLAGRGGFVSWRQNASGGMTQLTCVQISQLNLRLNESVVPLDEPRAKLNALHGVVLACAPLPLSGVASRPVRVVNVVLLVGCYRVGVGRDRIIVLMDGGRARCVGSLRRVAQLDKSKADDGPSTTFKLGLQIKGTAGSIVGCRTKQR